MGASFGLWARLSTPPRLRRGYSAETRNAAAGTGTCERDRRARRRYLLKFPPRDDAAVTVEATPFYIAAPDACPRLATQLGRRALLVFLVREPVSRAYSE